MTAARTRASAWPDRTGSRSAPRAASCRRRRSSTASSPPPGSPTRPASTSATSTSTRWLLAPAERADVVVDFSQVRRPDADPLQRRAGSLPGSDPELRLLHRRSGPEPGRRPDDPARLRAEHPHHHAGEDRRQPLRLPRSTSPSSTLPSPTRPTAPACSSQASTRSSSGRPPTTRPTARASWRRRLVQRPSGSTSTQCDGYARINEQGGDMFKFDTLTDGLRPVDDLGQDRAEGHPRRDELLDLRRVRPDAGQPGRRGRPGHARVCRTSSCTRTPSRSPRSSTRAAADAPT